jgi:hypothetical protein
MTQSASALIRAHQRNNRAVQLGTAWLFEMTRQTAILALSSAIEQLGGQVISVTSETRPTDNPVRTVHTVYTVVAILPDDAA